MYGQSSFLDISGTVLKIGPFGIKINVDSIALSRDGKALYYGALTGNKLFCIDTTHILSYINAVNHNGNITSPLNALEMNIHTTLHGKPATDGITIDDFDNIHMTAIEVHMI
jgi:sugar lactone lactonase YvrE